MKDRFFKMLGIEPGEESLITLLFAQSVFLGIFLGAFDISAHSFFLSVFDEKMMARGYILSGLAGIILTSLYTFLQTKTRFRSFSVMNLAFVASVTFILWILLRLNPGNWIIWLVFIMLGPLNILAMLGFWGTAGRLFSLRQGKRLFGLVDAGLIAGIIVSSYAVPVLLSFNFEPHNILLISAGAVLTGCFIQIITGSRFNLSPVKDEMPSSPEVKRRSLVSLFREDKYILTMALFVALSVMCAFFVQYSFMGVTREQYPAESDMARFLGLFTGSMMIFTLIVKLFVFSYLIRNYGLKTCLALSPILITGFAVIAVLLGTLKGYTPAAGLGFLLFFMILALARLFSKSLKDSIESPSFKVIYQTLGEDIRYEIQSSIDGTVNEIAALTSGLILTGLGLLSFVHLIHFSIVLIVISSLWIIVAFKLYSGYRNSIRKALGTKEDEKPLSSLQPSAYRFSSRVAAEMAVRRDYFSLISGEADLPKENNVNYYNVLIDIADSEKDITLIPVLKKISTDQSTGGSIRERAGKVAESLDLLSADNLLRDDKIFTARKLLAGPRAPQTTQILRLLRDNSLASRKMAIMMIGKFRLIDMIHEVCESLEVPELESYAAGILRSFKGKGDEEIRRFYLLKSGNIHLSKIILSILAQNPTGENKNFLFESISSTSRHLRETAIEKLIGCGFIPGPEERDRLHQMISDTIGIIVWNLSARIILRKQNEALLLEAIDNEISRWNIFLFNLLSVTYDPSSIKRIRENLENGTVESVNYALEMIDIVIDETIKPKVVPLLDVIPDEEKVRLLFQFYPGEIPDLERLKENILNRDYNLLGVWIRACVLRSMENITSGELKESVIAMLFSPETILREESAALLVRKGSDILSVVGSRIPDQWKDRISTIAGGTDIKETLLYQKVLFLTSCFPGMMHEDLVSLAGALNFTGKTGNALPSSTSRYLEWARDTENVKVVYGPGIATQKSYSLPLSAVEEYCSHFPERAEYILNYLEINES